MLTVVSHDSYFHYYVAPIKTVVSQSVMLQLRTKRGCFLSPMILTTSSANFHNRPDTFWL